MKKTIALLMTLTLITATAAGCGYGSSGAPAAADTGVTAQTEAGETGKTGESGQEGTTAENGAPIADGMYQADFNTDGSMFHVNETKDGKGILIVSCHTVADTPELRENIARQLKFEEDGLRFAGYSHDYEGPAKYTGKYNKITPYGGKTVMKVKNLASTNLNLAARLTIAEKRKGGQSRTFVARAKESRKIGDTITLEAIPNGGYAFEMWNDSVTTNPRDILVTQDSTFTAMFVEKHYTITVESDHPGWGNVTGGGVFNYGDTIQISATPYLGFAFAGWTDGVYTNPRTVIVTDDATYTAHFEVRQCMISTNVTPEGAGTVNGGGTYN